MRDFCLGVSIDYAKAVFLLPNRPILPERNDDLSAHINIQQLIALNGNHWRKIFTIMAKLQSPNYDGWKAYRDNQLLADVAIVFSPSQLSRAKGYVYVVGQTFRGGIPVTSTSQHVGKNHIAYIDLPYIWCPYLDYRQFPNSLIEAVRQLTLEKLC